MVDQIHYDAECSVRLWSCIWSCHHFLCHYLAGVDGRLQMVGYGDLQAGKPSTSFALSPYFNANPGHLGLRLASLCLPAAEAW